MQSGESPHQHAAASHVLVSKIMSQNDNELNMLKPKNEAACEGKGDLTATLCRKKLEDIDYSLPRFMDNEASINRNPFDSKYTDALLRNLPDNSGLIKEEPNLYLEKAVAQVKLPEIIVLSKDETCPFVKDICIDGGLYSPEKVMFKYNEDSEKTSVSETNMHDDLNGQIIDGVLHVMQDLKFVSAVDKVVEDQNSSWSLSEVEERPNTDDQASSYSSAPKINLRVLPSPTESDTDHRHVDPTSFDFSSDHRQSIEQGKIEQNKVEDACPTMAALPFGADESYKSIGVMENPTNDTSKILGGCSVTTDVISDATTSNHVATVENPANGEGEVRVNNPSSESAETTTSEEKRGNRDTRGISQAQNYSVSEMTVPDATTAPARSSFHHNNYGDLNFSGIKASSGHIAYSGNISMRSDSSTTSTRSFAFPILQTEWNTSPVKMAKARKSRCWSVGLICCKF